ncbi:hypothetical protein FRC12_006911 [Ceratobasidium sp. 428]|nr:hypothetical protein FRC12_006911 [Ceratobasidium sp. 428]
MHFLGFTFVSALFFLVTSGASAEGDFTRSCPSYHMEGNSKLVATCKHGNGFKHTSIDLNKCIANRNGKLACARE